MIHRDLKPGNLLLTPEGQVKVADFGLARPVEKEDGALTQEGAFLGTPMYSAPEQARGEELDHRADMYALGATFFHLLSNRPVFSAPTAMALLLKHITEPAPAIEQLGIDVSPRLAAIVARLLAKSPDERFVDYDALIEALEDARPRAHVDAGILVRSMAYSVDFVLIVSTSIAWTYAPLIAFPLYFIGAWLWRGSTIGQWLFRIKTLRDDNGALTPLDAVRRFAVMNWGVGVLFVVGVSMRLGFDLEQVTISKAILNNFDQFSVEIVFFLLFLTTLMLWWMGCMVGGLHPRKRSVHDLLTKTKVVYRMDDAV